MDSDDLNDLLGKVNERAHNEMIFIRPLLNNVDVAVVWFKSSSLSEGMPKISGPCQCYFVKTENGEYVSLVMDGGSDLHWYTLLPYRGKGYLSKALRQVILPHLFQDRKLQNITINYKSGNDVDPLASAILAKSVGFKLVKKENQVETYILSGEKFDSIEYFNGDLAELSSARAEILKNRIAYYSKNLQMVCSELMTKLGRTDELEEIEENITGLHLNLSSVIVNAYEDKLIQ